MKTVKNIDVLQNHEHAEGGCMSPVMVLKDKGVNVIILGGIGMRPLMGFRPVAIIPFAGVEGSVELNLKAYIANKLPEMTQASCVSSPLKYLINSYRVYLRVNDH
jgi:predicted Fe-Mo cluster-binding NifX family protein